VVLFAREVRFVLPFVSRKEEEQIFSDEKNEKNGAKNEKHNFSAPAMQRTRSSVPLSLRICAIVGVVRLHVYFYVCSSNVSVVIIIRFFSSYLKSSTRPSLGRRRIRRTGQTRRRRRSFHPKISRPLRRTFLFSKLLWLRLRVSSDQC
jgi:hypothetical protein